jgi:hypothetical protein
VLTRKQFAVTGASMKMGRPPHKRDLAGLPDTRTVAYFNRIVAINVADECFSERFERHARIDLKSDVTGGQVTLAG